MELDDKTKLASRKLSDAVNAAAEESETVREAIRRLREMGYEPRLTFQLDLAPIFASNANSTAIEEDFTDDDRKTLRRMLIDIR